MGDVKLLTSMALALGSYSPMSFLAALSVGLVVATVVSITRIAIKKLTPNSSIALGPYLMLGFALIAIEPVGGFVVTVVA
jgi:leader peptidase (prepilin peptidase)/N-methyltransferase